MTVTSSGCPECGGTGARGCGAAWHDGKPDAPSPLDELTAAPTRPTREQLRKAVHTAIYDPGFVVKRENHTDGDPDELHVWQTKAVMATLAELGLIGGDDA